MKSGTYSIINKLNGKQYVGSTVDFARRLNAHRSKLRNGKHHSPALQRAWDLYGEESFAFEIVARCPKGMCIAIEQALIDGLVPEYNIAKQAGSRLGVGHSEATKAKMRAAARKPRPPFTPEHRAAISAGKKGKSNGPISAAHRAALLAANVGKPCSPEKRAKISAAHAGKTLTEEHKGKIRAHMGLPSSRARSSAAALAQWHGTP
jgi:group I intron endonuclease